MRILIISDTHIPTTTQYLPPIIENEAKRSDCCLHAGDLIDIEVFEKLSQMATTYAVCGNMDNENVRDKLPLMQIIKFEEITLGLTHGRGAPHKVINCLDQIFGDKKDNIDIFVFGHSHIACDKEINGKIYFNPGSCTDTIFTPQRTYGILEIKKNAIKRRIISLE